MTGRPSRILYVDATAGAAGDMMLGAFFDLGVPVPAVRRALSGLPLGGWSLSSRRVVRGGVAAVKAVVRVPGDGPDPRHVDHHGKSGREIRRIISKGGLAPAVRDRALAIFARLIEAEAHAHGLDPEKVHLHEAGAADAIVDVVGTCAALAHLAPARVVVSPLTTGWGEVACAHGKLPVPGPATAWMLRGVPLSGIDAEGERLTPTGAAILTTIADAWGALPAMTPEAVGYGAGDREFPERPNCVRLVLGTADPTRDRDGEVVVVECTLDDATPQQVAYASERLFEAGAIEVFTTPVHMKKGRAGHLLTALARPSEFESVAEALLRETPTLGVRFRREGRIELARLVRTVSTPFGRIRVKAALRDGRELRATPEYDDCAAAATRHGVPIAEVQRAALAARPGAKKAGRKGNRA